MNKETGKIVVLLAHPDLAQSKANKELCAAIKNIDGVVIYQLYGEDEKIFDANTWKEIMHDAAALVFQFPLYWLSAPYILKRWQDEVFTALSQTPAIQNKPMLVVTTTGSEGEAYRSGGRNEFTMDEILRPYQAGATHGGMVWQTPLVVYGTGTEEASNNISAGCDEYRKKIKSIISAI